MYHRIIILTLGYLLDLLFGDPLWLYHPVTGIGKLITFTEKSLRSVIKIKAADSEKQSQTKQLIIGILLFVIVCITTTALALGLLLVAYRIHYFCGLVIESLMCYQILAVKSLKTESMKVYDQLISGNIEDQRKAVSRIVGRDTKTLDEEGIIKASVETIAENTSDGVVAPIFYMVLFGAAGGFFYKAINTMDSMVGYKNKKYLYVGRAAAIADDVVNYIPARLSACYMILSAFLLRLDWKQAIHIFRRDRYHHASPNSAQTEAVCAGALGVQLAGDAYYFGQLYPKKTIGDKRREVCREDIRTTNRLLYMTAFIAVLAADLLMYAIVRGL